MARINHVKRAQQRYATKPVIDPATGVQKVTPMINTRTGQPKLTKHGRPVVLRITERDLERPLPMPKCDAPECTQPSREIAVGTPYKWIEPSGQAVRNRHASCLTWNVWEYSSSLSARIAQITDEGPGDFDSLEDAQQWAADKASEIRELAEEKRESAQNMEDGFGHATSMSDELNETADSLDEWADEIENVDLPEFPEEEDTEDGDDSEAEDGEKEDEEYETKLEEWREEVRQALDDVLGNSPV